MHEPGSQGWNLLNVEPLAVDGIVVASSSLEALFRSERTLASDGSQIFGRLHLPKYQRPYRWDTKQLERLLQDLRIFIPEDPYRQSARSHDFYLGSIILRQDSERECSKSCHHEIVSAAKNW